MGWRVVLWCSVLAIPSFAQSTWHVDDDATPPGDGSAQNPYASIQYAISQPSTRSGDRILVAGGIYAESIDFLGKTLVLHGVEGAFGTVLDGAGAAGSLIVAAGGEGPGTRIQGFTIRGANPGGAGVHGGAVRVQASVLELRECALTDNGAGVPTALQGGAVAVLAGELALVRCRFVRCRAEGGGGAVFASASRLRVDTCSFADCGASFDEGGAVAAYEGETEIVRSSFQRNVAWHSRGGALYLELGAARVADCEFRENTAADDHQGGALATEFGDVRVERCLFERNVASAGGAIRANGDMTVRDCRFTGNEAGFLAQGFAGGSAIQGTFGVLVRVERSTFWRNRMVPVSTIDEQGAVIGCLLERCTLVDNTTEGPYAGAAAAQSTLRDCVVWGNTPAARSVASSTVLYCDVDEPHPGPGNLSLDPRFVDAPGGDLRLLPGSPCIDAGDPASAPDLDGSRADMGAHEFHPSYGAAPEPGCQGKVNGDGCVPYAGHNGAPPSVAEGLFVVRGRNHRVGAPGLLVWSLRSSPTPFQGGVLCVGAPFRRTPLQISALAVPGAHCPGEFEFAWTSAAISAAGLGAGDTVHCQFWGRDPGDRFGSSLSDLLSFQLVP